MLKVPTPWVSQNLNAHDLHQTVASSRDPLSLYIQVTKNWFHDLIIWNKLWIHHWDWESKLESVYWKQVDYPIFKEIGISAIIQYVMATVLWDSDDLLMMDCLPPGKTMTGPYYAQLMFKLHDVIREKRWGKLSLVNVAFHNSASVH